MTYNVWNKWGKLKTVMLGQCYAPEFFKDIKNEKIRVALMEIAKQTQEDLSYFEKVLKDFGCTVLQPELDPTDSIANYMHDGALNSIPRPPLQPRDSQVVIGNKLFYTDKEENTAIRVALDRYNSKDIVEFTNVALPPNVFNAYKGGDAPDWPTYFEYIERIESGLPVSDKEHIVQEFADIASKESTTAYFWQGAPSITVVGKDIYLDKQTTYEYTSPEFLAYKEYSNKKFIDQFSEQFRINTLTIGGHNDGSFHTVAPGAILSAREIQEYSNTFPDWEVHYIDNPDWSKVSEFMQHKTKVDGKWWVPGLEHNTDFSDFVETWLSKWVGYVEETIFDVNVLMLDEHHCCVSNMNNEEVNSFLRQHNIEPIYIPWRHRHFWDGGLHCITLDLEREGQQEDYFPMRTSPVNDAGFF